MLNLAKWYGVFLLVLPCMAKADTVEITSMSRGTIQPDHAFLALLGISSPVGDGTLPYSLKISSFVDTAAPGYYEERFGSVAGTDATQVGVDITFGDQSFHYAGQGGTFLSAQKYGYTQGVYFSLPQSPSIEFSATHFVGMPALPLSPWSLDNVGPLDFNLGAYLSAKPDQNSPGATVGLEGEVASFSIQAVSPIPEPAPATLLAGGLALLMWHAVRRRFRPEAFLATPWDHRPRTIGESRLSLEL